jgi:Asp-tRNA(Asn)/Glu-tRNA(Gln) amidotransferase C subunit
MVDIDDVRRIARLARLELDAHELQRLAGDLAGLLSHIDVLGTVPAPPDDAANEPAHAQTDTATVVPDPLHIAPPYFAPDWREGFFAAPRAYRQTAEP